MMTVFLTAVLLADPSTATIVPPPISARSFQQALAAPIATADAAPRWSASRQLRPRAFRPRPTTSPRIRAAVAGAVTGLFVGGALGGLMMNRDDCDTCALGGITVGAPIGAAVGALLAIRVTK